MSAKKAVKYLWSEQRRRYTTAGGRAVPLSYVDRALAVSIKDSQAKMKAIAGAYKQGAISLPEFQLQMRDEIKLIHATAAAAARGGWAQMSQSDFGRLGAALRFQYEKLNKWSLALEQGLLANVTRAGYYALSARNTFWNLYARFVNAAAPDQVEAYRQVHPGESCAGCLAVNGKVMPIEELLAEHPIGSKECMFNCNCTIEIIGLNAA